MKLDPAQLAPATLHRMMDRIVVPRPVVLISTLGEEAAPHLASVSWYSTAIAYPPVQYFSIMRDQDEAAWTVLQDIRRRGDFVINSVDEALATRLVQANAQGPQDADGFKRMGLTAAPSAKVKAPRVAESPAQMECVVLDLLELANGAVTVVFGSVVQFHVRDDILYDGKIDFARFQTLGQLAGGAFTRTHDIYELAVPQVGGGGAG